MTRKDYKAVAAVLANHYTDPSHCTDCAAKSVTVSLIAFDLAAVMQADNPRFQADKFYRACGLSDMAAN